MEKPSQIIDLEDLASRCRQQLRASCDMYRPSDGTDASRAQLQEAKTGVRRVYEEWEHGLEKLARATQDEMPAAHIASVIEYATSESQWLRAYARRELPILPPRIRSFTEIVRSIESEQGGLPAPGRELDNIGAYEASLDNLGMVYVANDNPVGPVPEHQLYEPMLSQLKRGVHYRFYCSASAVGRGLVEASKNFRELEERAKRELAAEKPMNQAGKIHLYGFPFEWKMNPFILYKTTSWLAAPGNEMIEHTEHHGLKGVGAWKQAIADRYVVLHNEIAEALISAISYEAAKLISDAQLDAMRLNGAATAEATSEKSDPEESAERSG